MSSIDPIRPVSGPREPQPYRRRRREEPAEEQPREELADQRDDDADDDARPTIDLRA